MPTVSNKQLIDAAKAGDLSVLKEWNKQNEGGDVNRVANYVGETPLHWACRNGHLGCVKYLIESTKAGVNRKNMLGVTPLHWACINGQLECAKYLIESCQVDVNRKRNFGSTPLHDACANGHLEFVKYLIESTKADVNSKDNDGDTPLHRACAIGSSECVEYLIASTKADVDIKNNSNKTPLDMIQADDQIKMMRSIMTRLRHFSRSNSKPQPQLQMNKQIHTNTITSPSKHDSPATCTTTNISIGQDRRSAVRTNAKTDVTFLCGQGDEQQPIKVNSGVLMVTVPSIQTLIDSGIQRQRADDGTGDEPDDGAAPIQTTVPLPNFQPKHVQYVLQCIYTGEISFDDDVPDNIETDDNAHDNANADDANQPTPTLNGHEDLQQLILVANEFGFWRLKLVLEAELARKHLTEDSMIDTLVFADEHNCVVLKDAAMRMAAESEKDMFSRPDFRQLFQQPQLMEDTHALCSGGMESDEVDDEYSGMSMIELYKVVDEDTGTAQVDTYMDRVALLAFVRSIKSSRVIETQHCRGRGVKRCSQDL